MLSAWIVLILNSLVFTLRLSGNTGSFPRPLKPEEEQRCLALVAQGDTAARNTLVEHNLRLVAHIVKKCYPERRVGKWESKFQGFAVLSFVAYTKGKV